jgi:hypothetical protein
MDPKFAAVVEQLAPKLELLLAMAPCRDGNLPANMPAKGVYLFTETAITCMSAARTTFAAASRGILSLPSPPSLVQIFCANPAAIVACGINLNRLAWFGCLRSAASKSCMIFGAAFQLGT